MLLVVTTLFGFESKTSLNPKIGDEVTLEEKYIVLGANAASRIVDEEELDVFDKDDESYKTVKLCPGTGVSCVINFTTSSDDDPVYLVSRKGQGQPNILVVN